MTRPRLSIGTNALAFSLLLGVAPGATYAAPPRFTVSFKSAAHAGPITGRLVVFLAKTNKPEPRLALQPRGPAIFAIDINQLQPGQSVTVDNSAIGFPGPLNDLPAGDYYVQAVINVYEQVHRSDGKTIWVHLNDGRVEFFNTAAGNVYSDPQPVHIGGTADAAVPISITRVMPAQPKPQDSEWVKHVTIQSQLLTKFWGRPIYVQAHVLLPKGYTEHPTTYYPSVYTLGHGQTPLSFSTTPPRAPNAVSPVTGLESGYATYQKWISDNYPRLIAITLEQQTPYFPDSYSVNSVNNGPYGDAITQEIIPELEKQFRIIPKPYARQLEGASTSGWQSLALQLQHPDFFGGAWIFQPDPIDFTRYGEVNIYSDTNAFSMPTGPFTKLERPFQRTTDGQPVITMRELSRFEAVLGSRGRSSYQLEAWEAIYGPIDADGYPVPLWDKLTGTIDPKVATYMRDHGYDLRAYAEKEWPTIGSKLVGKLHFSAGDMDDYWLNLAVYKFEDFLKSTQNPHYEGDFVYGRPMKGHSWHYATWAEFMRKVGATIKSQAPAGENTAAWNY